MSFVAESPLTGPGAGGFMLVHTAAGENHLLDFFVAAPGRGLADPDPAPLLPIDVAFAEDALQRFNCGPSSCGAYGTTAGLAEALGRFGTAALADLTAAPARAARDGVEVIPMQAFLFEILGPILRSTPEVAAIYEPEGRPLRAGERIRLPELADLLDRLGAEGPGFLYSGDVAAAVSDWVLERGGLLTREDLASYEVVERPPARARFRGREVLTNPPPSSGGILIADALELLERIDRPGDVHAAGRGDRIHQPRPRRGLPGGSATARTTPKRFLAEDVLDSVAGEVASRLGSTTHLAVMDADGACATVTCSNGSCSGVVVPGTGMHLNNMLGEEDLNPHGFHRIPAGRAGAEHDVPHRGAARRRARDGAGIGRVEPDPVGDRADGGRGDRRRPRRPGAPSRRPRLHVEDDLVDAEPGVDEAALRDLEAGGWRLRRWDERNLYFGGVQAVARDPATGELSGGGDPRRGGVVVSSALRSRRWRPLVPAGPVHRRRFPTCGPMTAWAARVDPGGMPERLTALDGSFLRVETENAHMHVAWSALLGPRRTVAPLPLRGLRRSIEARLEQTPAVPPAAAFGAARDGRAVLGGRRGLRHRPPRGRRCAIPTTAPTAAASTRSCDRALSEPLDRTRPLWRVYLAPKLADGGAGMVAKIHHALVDGKSAVEVALLLFDVTPDTDPAPAADWRPEPEPGTAGLALGALSGGAAESLRAARGVARIAGAPRAGGARIYDTVRRAALAVGDDLLRPAPASYLNVPIGPRRTLVRHRARMSRRAGGEARGRRDAQRRLPGGGGRGAARDGAGPRRFSARAEGDGARSRCGPRTSGPISATGSRSPSWTCRCT